MKKIMLALLLCASFSLVSAEQFKVAVLLGNASMMPKGSADWKAVKVNSILSQGDRIKLDAGAAAQLISSDKRKILKLSEKTEMEIVSSEPDNVTKKIAYKFQLASGKIWADVKKLSKNETMLITTPSAVAGVRGTTLIVTRENGVTKLFVIEGKVNFGKDELDKGSSVKGGFVVSLGDDGTFTKPRKISEEEQKQMLNGIPILIKTRSESEDSRELKSEIDSEKSGIADSRSQGSDKRSSDLTTGRTLKDIHGNVVRVEQILKRPDTKTINLINLTKRNDGPQKGITFFDIKTVYVKDLPSSIVSLFVSPDPDNRVDTSETRIGKVDENGARDGLMYWKGSYDPNTEKYQESFRLYDPATKDYTVVRDAKLDDISSVGGDSQNGQIQGAATIQLYEHGTSTPREKISLKMYLINNDGKVLGSDGFQINENTDIFGLLQSVAGEVVLGYYDFNTGRDITIDSVGTMDIIFVIIQKIF